jgi:hypothetical protein
MKAPRILHFFRDFRRLIPRANVGKAVFVPRLRSKLYPPEGGLYIWLPSFPTDSLGAPGDFLEHLL